MRIMTYNLRYDEPNDPVSWPERLPSLAEQIRRESPDILGTQEGLHHQLRDLTDKLTDYRMVGIARGPDRTGLPYDKEAGEYNALFYRKEALLLRRSGTFWLSSTPDVPGTRGPNSELPRICTWGEFLLPSNESVFAFNTHFPHESGKAGRLARAFAAKVLHNQVQSLSVGQPAFLMGDFNASADDVLEAQEALTVLREQYEDTFQIARERLGPAQTFYGFDSKNQWGVRIDYVWVGKWSQVDVGSHRILNDRLGRYYLSDHLPVVVDIKAL